MKRYQLLTSGILAASLCFASSGAWALCGGGSASPSSTVTPNGSGAFDYAYTVFGDVTSCAGFYGPNNFYVTQFSVPYFADAGVTTITSPTGWTSQIVPTDSFSLGNGAETLVWTAGNGYGITPSNGFVPASSLTGFGYTDSFSPVKGPSSVAFSGGFAFTFDPALPGSHTALSDGLQPTSFPSTIPSVPEPSSYALVIAGLAMIGVARARKRGTL